MINVFNLTSQAPVMCLLLLRSLQHVLTLTCRLCHGHGTGFSFSSLIKTAADTLFMFEKEVVKDKDITITAQLSVEVNDDFFSWDRLKTLWAVIASLIISKNFINKILMHAAQVVTALSGNIYFCDLIYIMRRHSQKIASKKIIVYLKNEIIISIVWQTGGEVFFGNGKKFWLDFWLILHSKLVLFSPKVATKLPWLYYHRGLDGACKLKITN